MGGREEGEGRKEILPGGGGIGQTKSGETGRSRRNKQIKDSSTTEV